MEKTISNLEALQAEADALVQSLAPKAAGATLITLSGELGAGKTTFTQALARALGVSDVITSPTFVLEKIYTLPEGTAFTRLIHIDAYRLKAGEELHALGFKDLMQDAGNLIMLEWPERVHDGLPSADISIILTPLADGARTLTYA